MRQVKCHAATRGRSATLPAPARAVAPTSTQQLRRWMTQPSAPVKQQQLQKIARGPPVEQLQPDLVQQLQPDEVVDYDYSAIEARPHNKLIQALFRNKMAKAVGADVPHLQGYDAIIALTRQLNLNSPIETQTRTVEILKSLFPSWLLPAFKVMFSRPMPGFACKLNAWATALTCEWLMGPCKVIDVEVDGGKLGVGQGVAVQRCRYLEQAGCTSICVNSCKVPTQTFFAQEMGLSLTMTPNYEDFSCQFSFGKTPPPQAEDPAFAAPCFSKCPSKRQDKADAFAQLQEMAAANGAGNHQVLSACVGGPATGRMAADRCHKVRPQSS